jgi:UDP-N-acetylglucosamine 2-epimerase (non-hydrolysing)
MWCCLGNFIFGVNELSVVIPIRRRYLIVGGARPNFMKIAPLVRAAKYSPIELKIVHTGQHYDPKMTDVFFQELAMPLPHYQMNIGPGSQTMQMAKIMLELERICLEEKPYGVIVVGDVTSTIAAALVAKRLNIEVNHVEAGLRCGDMQMPEEINRILTDAISDRLFVTEYSGLENLEAQGIDHDKVYFVGHVMVDNLLYQLGRLPGSDSSGWISTQLKKKLDSYAVVTLHRPNNVDDPNQLAAFSDILNRLSQLLPIVFPVHPRTRAKLDESKIKFAANVFLVDPLPYMDFLNLWKDAKFVLTDSGGLQEETTALGVPCMTARASTERPVTVTRGSNILVGSNANLILETARAWLANQGKRGKRPALWDGNAATRIVEILSR